MLAILRGALFARAGLGLAALLLSATAYAGKLGDAGRATRTPSAPTSSTSSSSDSSSDCHSSRCGHDDDGAAAAAALYILTSPWTVPYFALEPTDRGRPAFEDYPYSGGSNGLLRYREPERDEGVTGESAYDEHTERNLPPASGKSIAGQIRVDGGYIFGGVYRGGVGARLMTSIRLELDANLHALAEPLATNDVDRATFGNTHLGLRFAQSEHLQFRTGFGYQQFADELGVAHGVDFLYGFDAQLGSLLVLSVSGNLGSAGHAFVGQARGSLGVMLGRLEVFAGYDHISIGSVMLGGPAVGVRAWL